MDEQGVRERSGLRADWSCHDQVDRRGAWGVRSGLEARLMSDAHEVPLPLLRPWELGNHGFNRLGDAGGVFAVNE